MFDWILHPGGCLGLFAFMVLTGCGLPLPEEVAIVTAGVLCAQGQLKLPEAFTACLLGALIGDAIMYRIGYRFGHSLLSMHPKLAKLLGAQRGEEFERAIARHGFKVLLLARFMVGVRGPVYLSAGVVQMPFRRFVLWDLVCASLVVGIFFSISYYLGLYLDKQAIRRLLHDSELTITALVLLALGAIALFTIRRNRRRLISRVLDGGAPVSPTVAEHALDGGAPAKAGKRDAAGETREAS